MTPMVEASEATQASDLGPGPLKAGSVCLLSEGLEVGSQS